MNISHSPVSKNGLHLLSDICNSAAHKNMNFFNIMLRNILRILALSNSTPATEFSVTVFQHGEIYIPIKVLRIIFSSKNKKCKNTICFERINILDIEVRYCNFITHCIVILLYFLTEYFFTHCFKLLMHYDTSSVWGVNRSILPPHLPPCQLIGNKMQNLQVLSLLNWYFSEIFVTKENKYKNANIQWRIEDFPGVLLFCNFCRKLHENERIWTPGVRPSVPSPAIGSANGNVIKPNVGLESISQILRSKIIMLLHEVLLV